MRKFFVVGVLVMAIMALSFSLALAQADQAVVDEVLDRTESIRELTASAEIPVRLMTREELGQYFQEEFYDDWPEEELKTFEELLVLFGWMEEGLDIRQILLDMYSEAILGFYDTEEEELVLISDDGEMNAFDRANLAHELTHYLQDQNFDLERPPFHEPDDVEEETDDDASLAAMSLVEGDAVITENSYIEEFEGEDYWIDMFEESTDMDIDFLNEVPTYIIDGLYFPYEEGLDFVTYLYKEGGYEAVDEAYANPPTTSEQILHPQKYIDGEGASDVELADISSELGSGWILDYDNVLGEFDVYELFLPYLSGNATEKASEGWGGNNYHYYKNDTGEKLLVQSYAWDSKEDAEEFVSGYAMYVQERFEGELEEDDPIGVWITWSTDDYRIGLKLDGNETYVVQDTADVPFEAALSELGEDGDVIDERILNLLVDTDEETDLSVAIISLVIGLLVLGLVLIVVMFVLYRRPPTPPSQLPGGPYGYGGGPGPGAVPWTGGQAPPPPPSQPPPQSPSAVPPPGGAPPQSPTISE